MSLPEPRMMFGFAMLTVIAIIAVIIALGHVRQDTSYGLDIVLGSLATLCGAFAQWAFSSNGNGDNNKPPSEAS